MRYSLVLLAVLMIGVVATAPAKTKKDAGVSKLFCQARFVYVETADGDVLNPETLTVDREIAIALEQHLQDWKRYTVVQAAADADLVWVVRTGRLVTVGVDTGYPTGDSRASVGVGTGSNGRPGGMGPAAGGNPNQQDPAGAAGGRGMPGAVSSQVGDPNDLLTIYEGPAEGVPQQSWLWRKSQAGGLVNGGMPLFEQIRNAIDTQCAQQTPSKP